MPRWPKRPETRPIRTGWGVAQFPRRAGRLHAGRLHALSGSSCARPACPVSPVHNAHRLGLGYRIGHRADTVDSGVEATVAGVVSTIVTALVGLLVWRVKSITSSNAEQIKRRQELDQWWANQFVTYLREQESEMLDKISEDVSQTRAAIEQGFASLISRIERLHESQTAEIVRNMHATIRRDDREEDRERV